MNNKKLKTKAFDYRDSVINMRISNDKKERLQRIVETLQTTRTKLLESHIDTLIDLYQ